MAKKCKIKGCGRILFASGWCQKHYTRIYRHGNPNTTFYNYDHSGRCSFQGCDRPYKCKGVCDYHYNSAVTRTQRNARLRGYQRMRQRDPQKRLGLLYSSLLARVKGQSSRRRDIALYKHLPILSREEFLVWANSTDMYMAIFRIWKRSGFTSKLAPALIRLDQENGYIVGNMRWVTKEEAQVISGKISRHGSKNYEA